MKVFKKTKLLVTALVLGLPITPILSQDAQEANAAMKVGTSATKIANTIKTGLLKPPLPPKPTNIPKAPNVSKIVNNLNTKPSSPVVSTPKGNVSQKITAFNNNSPSNGKAMGPISKRIAELNLSAKTQNDSPKINSKHGAVNSAISSLSKSDPSFQKQNTSKTKKLDLDSDFKNKLNGILGNGNPIQGGNKKQNTNKPGKLNTNNEASQKLESVFGNGNSTNKPTLSTNSSSTSSKAFENTDPNIPTAPPLPGSSNILTQKGGNTTSTPNIPDAPPLPQGSIPQAPPLPDKKPVTTTTSNGGSLQNQLTTKLDSGLNKTETNNIKKPINTGGNSIQDQLIKELNAKFNKK